MAKKNKNKNKIYPKKKWVYPKFVFNLSERYLFYIEIIYPKINNLSDLEKKNSAN